MDSNKKKNENLEADSLKEIQQQRVFLDQMNQSLEGKADELEKAKKELETQLFDQSHYTKELEQERIILNSINQKLEEKLSGSKQLEKKHAAEKTDSLEPHQKIESLLDLYKQITESRIAEFAGIDLSEVSPYLKKLESQGKVVKLQDRKEPACPECVSLKIEQSFHCPACKSINYRQANIIEHYTCGNISLEETYVNDKCPKCRKEIKALGVDYKIMRNFFVCRDCSNMFPELSTSFQCQNCNFKFNMEDAKWKI